MAEDRDIKYRTGTGPWKTMKESHVREMWASGEAEIQQKLLEHIPNCPDGCVWCSSSRGKMAALKKENRAYLDYRAIFTDGIRRAQGQTGAIYAHLALMVFEEGGIKRIRRAIGC